MDLTVGRTVSPTVDSTAGWTVGLTVKLCKHWFDTRSNYWSNWKSLANQWAERRLVTLVGGCRVMRQSVCNACASNGGGVGPFACRYQGKGATPVNILIPLKRQLMRYNFAADSFYIMKLCSRLLVLYCRNCMKDDKFRYLIPILRKLGAA